MTLPPVSRALTDLNIPHRVFEHPGQVNSLEQAAAERGQSPEQVIRSIVFRLGKDDYAMVLVAGAGQVSWAALRKYLGQSRLTTATEEELLITTGYTVGAVAPFGLPAPMRILADESVFAAEEISIGSGVRGTTVILRSDDLRRALGDKLEIGQFS